jgi:DNA-directed RNA polymerase specialized sigma24 family protein
MKTKKRENRLRSALYDIDTIKSHTCENTPERKLSTRQQVSNTLQKINFHKRTAFLLYSYEGYQLKEIANMFSLSIPTIASRIRAAQREAQYRLEK